MTSYVAGFLGESSRRAIWLIKMLSELHGARTHINSLNSRVEILSGMLQKSGIQTSFDEIAATAPNLRIEALDFSIRTRICLTKSGILTVAILAQHTESDLMQIHNLGKKSLCEIRNKLDILGIQIKASRAVTEDEAEGDEDEW